MNKIQKILKIAVVILFSATLVFSLIVSHDTHHLENCHEEHCAVCNIIHIAINIVNLLIAFIICLFIGFLIYFILSRLYKEQKSFVKLSPVNLKIQLNE